MPVVARCVGDVDDNGDLVVHGGVEDGNGGPLVVHGGAGGAAVSVGDARWRRDDLLYR